MSEPRVCVSYKRYCKHGHLRTPETTFERTVTHNKCNPPRQYIVRDCRVCHAMRNNHAPSWSKGRSKSKWSAMREDAHA